MQEKKTQEKRLPFSEIARENISDKLAKELERLILDRVLLSGEKLPAERELAEMYKVGRYTLREALKLLQAKGLIDIVAGKGIFIRSTGSKGFSEALTTLFLLEKEALGDLIETRCIVESYAAKMAAERATETDFVSMEEHLEKIKEAATITEQLHQSDKAFHYAIAHATHNSVFEQMVKGVRHSMGEAVKDKIFEISKKLNEQSSGSQLVYSKEFAEINYIYHQKIFDAIHEKNPQKAYDAMASHINEGLLIRYLEKKLEEVTGTNV